MTTHIYVCRTCRQEGLAPEDEPPGARLARAVEAECAARGLGPAMRVMAVNCLGVCKRPCTVSVGAEGKFAYVIGDLDAGRGAADIVDFAEAHNAAPDGIPAWRARPKAVRSGTVARVPPPGHAGLPVEPVAAAQAEAEAEAEASD